MDITKKAQDEENKLQITTVTSIILICLGLVVVLLDLELEHIFLQPNSCELAKLVFKFFELLGFTIFTSGVFTLLFQLPDWRNYFETRLKKIVLNQEYINSLDNDSLSNLQIKTLKAYFKTSDIDKDGSFLNYFQENISQFIKLPYREEVKQEINILKIDDDGIWISDRITYNCRMIGGKIQDHIKWRPDKDEFLTVENVRVKITRKDGKPIDIEKEQLVPIPEDKASDNTPDGEYDVYKKGFTFPLKEYNEDGLNIEINAKYKIQKGKFINWSMAHPTRNFYIVINYPKDWKIRFQPLFLSSEKSNSFFGDGFFSMTYNGWLLPMTGVVYSFVSKTLKE